MQEDLSRALEHPISQDAYNHWYQARVTQQFFLEIRERYLANILEEPVTQAYLERVAHDGVLPHTNPVEETAINSALKSGRNEVLESIVSWHPENMEIDDEH